MAWTFLGTLATDLDKIRFHTDLIVEDGKTLVYTDALLTALATERGTWEGAVADVWRRRAGNVARDGRDFSDGDKSQTESPYYQHCLDQAAEWEARHAAAATTSDTIPRATIRTLAAPPSQPFYGT